MNLNDLQIALIDNDAKAIHAVIDEVDRNTENELFLRAGEHFGFKTALTGGRRITYLRELVPVFQYSGPDGLRKLVQRYDLESVSLGGYGQNVRQFLMETFGIDKNSGHGTFVGWSTFLVAGMVATTPRADEIKRYLLNCERAARVGAGLMDLNKVREAKLKAAGNVISLINRAVRIPDPAMRQLALEHLDEALDGALRLPKQGALFGEE